MPGALDVTPVTVFQGRRVRTASRNKLLPREHRLWLLPCHLMSNKDMVWRFLPPGLDTDQLQGYLLSSHPSLGLSAGRPDPAGRHVWRQHLRGKPRPRRESELLVGRGASAQQTRVDQPLGPTNHPWRAGRFQVRGVGLLVLGEPGRTGRGAWTMGLRTSVLHPLN